MRTTVLRWIMASVVLAVAACTGQDPADDDTSRPQGGVSLQAQIRVLSDGTLRVQYRVENEGRTRAVLTDGVPADDLTRVAAPDPAAAYLRIRSTGVLEVSRRTFEPPVGGERTSSALMRGSLLEPGEGVNGTVMLRPPLTLRQPYRTGETITLDPSAVRTVVFCLGVVDPADLEPTLQTSQDEDDEHPVLRHPTPQLLLCSPETRVQE